MKKTLISIGFILSLIILSSCNKTIIVQDIQEIEIKIKIDTIYTYTYKVRDQKGYLDIYVTTKLFDKGDTIKMKNL